MDPANQVEPNSADKTIVCMEIKILTTCKRADAQQSRPARKIEQERKRKRERERNRQTEA